MMRSHDCLLRPLVLVQVHAAANKQVLQPLLCITRTLMWPSAAATAWEPAVIRSVVSMVMVKME